MDQRCYEQADCPAPKICGPTGRCAFECSTASDCATGFSCTGHVCTPSSAEKITCPSDMVAVSNLFCIDRFEASRLDASASEPGIVGSLARSAAGVLPWQVESNSVAQGACRACGKRLCLPEEWQLACNGPEHTVYAYGDMYDPAICNGIDTYGRDSFHLEPTGTFPHCTNEWGAYDLNGNLWEHVSGGSDQTIRGGAYNCSNSAALHRCDYVPGSWTPSARGFRCCLTPEASDGGTETSWKDTSSATPTASANDSTTSSVDSGCLDNTSSDPEASATDTDASASANDTESMTATNSESHSGPDTGTASDTGAESDTETGSDSGAGTGCPFDMTLIDSFCFDLFEASRSDATSTAQGTSTIASTRAGVLPWFSVTLAVARAACASMDKRLCRPEEWRSACGGPLDAAYVYGDMYDPTVCNGIDTFCYCDAASCAALELCPYPHCYNQPSLAESGGPCGASFHVAPTGSFEACRSAEGAYDVNGNVWELVDSTDGLEHFRGGAYNCGDSEALHRCDYDATWNPSARGFRCCRDRSPR
ncbi:MAG: SUMF1/EgtB/PvdO family nonheme iron enzyme [Myxococcota bacterium]|jgi:formylglycine-generating enzyme required for sulfatase activity|nr:SUMF1/EgtB/PvdO family nonheme iron enzyme [Myxococcota bacterium]